MLSLACLDTFLFSLMCLLCHTLCSETQQLAWRAGCRMTCPTSHRSWCVAMHWESATWTVVLPATLAPQEVRAMFACGSTIGSSGPTGCSKRDFHAACHSLKEAPLATASPCPTTSCLYVTLTTHSVFDSQTTVPLPACAYLFLCTTDLCINKTCSGHGSCSEGMCYCSTGFAGDNCERTGVCGVSQ